ncbi:MAG: Crp/Fnr family transcriptional regulator [Sphingomonas taxi]
MTHLQTEAPLNGIFNPLDGRANRTTRTPRGNVSANPLTRAILRYDTGGQCDASDITDAMTHIHEVGNRHHFPARSSARTAHVLVAGWGFRSQLLRDGARQITDLIAPGDFCHPFASEEGLPAPIEACGPARVATLNIELLPDRARAVVHRGQQMQQDAMIRRLHARLVSLGRRDARARLAYFMAETHARLAGFGLTESNRYDWPFTQEHLADILGLTSVHINRVLGRLRDEGLFVVSNRQVTILDLVGLRHAGDFEAQQGIINRGDHDQF